MPSLDQIRRQFEESCSLDTAIEFVESMVRVIGPGFHPDTPFGDYVSISGEPAPIFTSEEAEELDRALDLAVSIIDEAGLDPAEIGLPVQRELLSA